MNLNCTIRTTHSYESIIRIESHSSHLGVNFEFIFNTQSVIRIMSSSYFWTITLILSDIDIRRRRTFISYALDPCNPD